MVHKYEVWIMGRRMTVVGLLVVLMFSVHCKATEGNRKDSQSPRAQSEILEVSRRVIMMPVSVVGTPASGEETDQFQIRLYTDDVTAVPVIPVAVDFVYASSKDEGRAAGAKANILDVTIPVTLIGAPGPGETGYLREVQVFFVVGEDDMPRIPTEVRIVYASGEKPSLISLGIDSSRTAQRAACSWQNEDGVNHCKGSCTTGICAGYSVTVEDVVVTRCGCITVHPV